MTDQLTTLKQPQVLPVSVPELKTHMRLMGDDGSHDQLFARNIAAATRMVEDDLHRNLIARPMRLVLDQWPFNHRPYGKIGFGSYGNHRLPWKEQAIYLPQAPVQSVESITYQDPDDGLTTLDPADYHVSLFDTSARILPINGWPCVDVSHPEPIVVEFTAGYGNEPADVPEHFRALVFLTAEYLYENTGLAAPVSLHQIPGVDRIISKNARPVL